MNFQQTDCEGEAFPVAFFFLYLYFFYLMMVNIAVKNEHMFVWRVLLVNDFHRSRRTWITYEQSLWLI